ncbi:MAG: alkaline phosphatase [Salinivirgaceae bacterium]|nr:alkaline phosphatase [Salinivirgaceae bacterium]
MNKRIIFIGLAVVIALIGCKSNFKPKEAKYVFYFIGDGMGLAHVHLAENYLAEMSDGDYSQTRLNMFSMEHLGLSKTHCQNRLITGSAAAGTALSTGFKTSVNTIGMDETKSIPLNSIAKTIKSLGYKVGIMSTVSINHATPAVFYANVPSRKDYYDIGMQGLDVGYDFLGGGGFHYDKGKSNDKESLTMLAREKGVQVISKNDDFLKYSNKNEPVQFIHGRIDASANMPYDIDRNKDDLTLGQIVEKSIELLDNPKGFFMMVEGGKIDWASHSNDAATLVHDVLAFDDAIGVAIEFYKKHPENTLIVVCSDHETGGLGLGFADTKYQSNPSLLKNQRVSIDSLALVFNNYYKIKKDNALFNEVLDTLNHYLGFGKEALVLDKAEIEQIKQSFQNVFVNKKTKDPEFNSFEFASVAVTILNHKAGIGWTTTSHTSIVTGVFASGVNSELFAGFYDNIDVPRKIVKAMNIKHDFKIDSVNSRN